MKYCPECQEVYEEESEFCPQHGIKLLFGAPGGATEETGVPDYARLVGTELDGRYVVEEVLGEGGMGLVFRGRHKIIERPVAIKVLKREVASDQSIVQRFVQEARAATRIGHPSIVDVTDFGTLPDGAAYFVMEYLDGQPLSRFIQLGAPYSVERVLPIVVQMASALAAAHDKGIVHRDLKPDNVFLLQRHGRDDFVKIVDFGIAKVAPREGSSLDGPRLTQVGAVFGTPEYMAPEQAQGRADTDQRVDVYALGMIFYEMIVGKVAHTSSSTVATLAMQILDPIVPPRQALPQTDLSAEMEAVLMRALAKNRDERTPSMHQFLEELQQASGGVPFEVLGGTGSQRALKSSPATAHAQPAATPPPAVVAPSPTPAPPEPAPPTPKPAPEPARLQVSASAAHAAREGRRRSRSLGWIALVLALAAGGGVAAAVLLGTGASPGAGANPDGTTLAVVTPSDARSPLPPVAAPDAAVAQPAADAGAGEPDAPPEPDPERVRVVVRTRPPGGEILLGRRSLGTGEIVLSRPTGERVSLRCKKFRYVPGKVRVVFDGKKREYVCEMAELKGFPGE